MTQTTEVYVVDQFDNPVLCRVKIPGANAPDTRSTGYDGIAYFQFDEDKLYDVSVLPIDGYTLIPGESNGSFQSDSSYILLSVNKGIVDNDNNDGNDNVCEEFCSIGTYYPEVPRNADGSCLDGDVEHNSPCCDGDTVVQPHPAGGCHNTGNGGTNDHDGCGDGCPNTCDGTSLWSQKCVNGHCEKDALIESNSLYCKHVELPPIEDKSNIYLLIGAIILFIVLLRS